MGLLSPWFLGGLLAVGLPVWLHLLKRHKVDPHLFPSLMFFEHREQSSVKHRRLDYILLFILRTAMLVLLALLFTNPFINRLTAKGQGRKIVVVAVDRSFSMRTREGTGTRLDRAKQVAADLVAKIPVGTTAQVIALGGTTQAMTQQTTDPGELRSAVVAITASDSRASYGELSRYLRTLAENTKMPLEAHFVSDIQKSGMPPGFTDLRLDADTTLQIHEVGQSVANYAVENIVAPQRVYDPKKVRIQATVVGFGAPKATRNLTLSLNGKALQTKVVEIPENGRATAEFLGLDASYGYNKAEIRMDGTDALAEDNVFAFTVERTDPKKVLFIDDGRKRGALYFRTALDASPDAAFAMDVQRAEGAVAAGLKNYSLVVLSDPGELGNGVQDALKRYVQEGGFVLIALGPASAGLTSVPLAEDPIQSSRYAARDGERFLSVGDVDTGSPVVRDVNRFDGVKFYQAIRVEPKNSRVLVKLIDQTPLLLERRIGEGTVMTFASHFDNIMNDLPLHNSWVPFVQQAARQLGGGGADQPINVPVDSYVELRTADGPGTAEVTDAEGRRMLSLEEAAKARTIALNREGFFDVRSANGHRSLVAAHADRKESDLTVIPKETLDLWAGTGTGPAGDASGSTAAAQGLTKPWSLFPYILLLLLGVALAESVIANRYLRPAHEVVGAKGAA